MSFHSGRAGTGSTETETLHCIEESVVKEEVLRAGGTSDRFVLKCLEP